MPIKTKQCCAASLGLSAIFFAFAALLPAQTPEFSQYPVPTANAQPTAIALGPDGALWFTENTANKIGRVTTSGDFTEYPIPTASSSPNAITAGPDGALWFGESATYKIGRITTSGAITEYPLPTSSSIGAITTGPDGALWFTESSGANIGRIATNGTITEYELSSGANPVGIVAGPDGNLWFTANDPYVSEVGSITTGGTITEYQTPTNSSLPQYIVSGPDGALWFTEEQANNIGRVTTSGVITEYALPSSGDGPLGIANGPDGAVYFTDDSGTYGRISMSGQISMYGVSDSTDTDTVGIVAGPDGALWITDPEGNDVDRFEIPTTITTTSLPTSYQGLPYSATPVAIGGLLPYTWSVESGSLPAGLSLNASTGAITGTPTATGTFSFQLLVTDSSPTPLTSSINTSIRITAGPIPQFTSYSLPTSTQTAGSITLGSDGALWFSLADSSDNAQSIGRITTAGAITQMSPNSEQNNIISSLVLGPDGNVWFTNYVQGSGTYLGNVTPAGVFTQYSVSSGELNPEALTVGPDQNLWMLTESEGETISIYSTSGSMVNEFVLPAGVGVEQLATGPDQGVWFTETGTNEIGRMSTTGSVTQYLTANDNNFLAAGPDGAIWFTEPVVHNVARITTGGTVTEYPISHGPSTAIVAASDGALWFVENGAIGRVTTAGVVSEFSTSVTASGSYLAQGSDGAIWFSNGNNIVRLSFAAALALNCSLPNPAQVGVAYSGTCTGSGGTPGYTYSISAGSLPPGLGLNTNTGAISGTPTTPGTYSFTVQATDHGSPAQTATYPVNNFAVNAGPPASITPTSGSGQSAQVNSAFSSALVATVRDSSNDPVSGVSVTFTAPGSGASAVFSTTGTSTATVTTNASGVATSPSLTANGTAGGPYTVTATTSGLQANFSLTNTAISTTVTVAVSPNPSTLSQQVTLVANVGSGATGKVTFSFGTVLAGTAAVGGDGQAILTTHLLPSGTAPLRAIYSGDASHTGSTSAPLSMTVNSVPASTFVSAVNIGVGTSPTGVAVGDFNGDGYPDLAIVNGGDNTVTVLLNNGAGGFSPASGSPFAVGSNPSSIAVGDFNGDGSLDLAIANSGSNNVTILLGDGTGGFTQPAGSPFAVGARPSSVIVADFNSDSFADLAVTNGGSDNVTVLLGDGAGGFTQADGSPFATGSTPSSVTAGDFNGDGLPDLAIANSGSNNVTVLLGNGSGGFTLAAGSPYASGADPLSIAAADFNHDGFLDLATADEGDNTVTVLLGAGNGSFSSASGSPVSVPPGPRSIVAGDFNGDGVQDFAVATAGGAAVLLSDGNGGFTQFSGNPFAVDSNPSSIAVGDFNADGKTDAAVANQDGADVSVLRAVGPANSILATSGTPQSTGVNTPFPAPLGATARDSNNNAVPNVTITFTAPTSGASGTFPDGVTTAQVQTDSSGIATAPTFTANGTAGSYSVTATLPGGTSTATFSLTNTVSTPPLSITTTSLPSGTVSIAYSATVAAQGGTTPYTWSISSGSLPAGLSLNSSTGAISGTPDGSAGTSNFTVQVVDSSSPTQSATQALSITIQSAPPPLSITTSALASGTVGSSYSATVAAQGGTTPYHWSVVTGSGALPAGLTLNASTGVISGTPTGPAGTSSFTVQVIDSSSPAQSATQALSITIQSAPVPLSITTTALASGTVGSSYSATLAAQGGATPYHWSVVTGSGALPAGLTLNASTGVISGTPSGSAGTSSFTVQVLDSSSPAQSATQALSITIQPAPVPLSITTSQLPSGTIGSSYSATLAAQGGTTPYQWSVVAGSGALPSGLTLNASTGVISGTPAGPAGTSSFTIQVIDSSSPAESATQALSITIQSAPVPLSITTSSLASGTIASAYSATLAAQGGATPYHWSVVTGSGTLPAGLTLNASTGVISGTPTGPAGTSSFTVQVVDSSLPAESSTEALSIAVQTAPVPLSITTSSLSSGTIGNVYSGNLAAQGGTAPYTWSVVEGSLPTGLSLNSSTGAISGTPSGSAGTSSFTVEVTDSSSPAQAATQPLSINIVAATPPLSVTTTALENGSLGTAYSASLGAQGGSAPYTWSIVPGSGALPAGLTLNSDTGLISGTPTGSGGTSSFTVQVSDTSSPVQSAIKALSITIEAEIVPPPPLTLTTGSLSNGTVGTVYSGSLSAQGGTSPYTWSIVAGALPAGLALNSATGVISGTPSGAAGTSTFTVQVADSSLPAQAVTRALSITVENAIVTPPALSVTTATLSNGIVGGTYSASLAAQGGTAPYTWSISAGALPAGLALSASTGVITGSPTTAGTYSFTVSIQDSSTPALNASKPLSIAVNPLVSLNLPNSIQQPGASIANGQIQTGQPTPSAITGTVSLAFNPNAAGLPNPYNNPGVCFAPTSTCANPPQTTASFTIPAGSSGIALPSLLTGTVAGDILVTLDVTGQSATTSTVTVPQTAPVIEANSVQILDVTSTGFTVELVANSSPRNVQSVTFTFNAASGAQISGNNTFTVDVSSTISTWYNSSEGQSYGSAFSLQVPFTFSGDVSAIQSVTVTLTNSAGTSTAVTGTQ